MLAKCHFRRVVRSNRVPRVRPLGDLLIGSSVATIFDYVTIASFLAMAGAFFMLTEREPRTLLHFLAVGTAFAVANQLGNAGHVILSTFLIVAGITYSILIIRQRW
jgi:hypothetical protein